MNFYSINAGEGGFRSDLANALANTCTELGSPGAWLDGSQRLAVAAEARNAWACDLCRRRKEALSPYRIEGNHEHISNLPGSWVEVVHRVVTDSGRITRAWYDSVIGEDLGEDEFIEVLSIACITTGIDTFARGIGAGSMMLSPCESSKPHCKRPEGTRLGPGWAQTIAPEDAGPELENFYDLGPFYIRRALTLVPDEANRFWNLMNVLYLPDPGADGLGKVERGITRPQIEFLAARVSSLLGCYY
jgi:hypothetical protein